MVAIILIAKTAYGSRVVIALNVRLSGGSVNVSTTYNGREYISLVSKNKEQP